MEPFRPNRGPLKLSPNMIIENLAKVLDISADTIDSISDFADAPDAQQAEAPRPGTGLRVWTVEEAAAAAGKLHKPQPLPPMLVTQWAAAVRENAASLPLGRLGVNVHQRPCCQQSVKDYAHWCAAGPCCMNPVHKSCRGRR